MGLLDTIKGIFKGNKIYRYNDFLAAMTSHRGQGTGGMVVSDKTAMNFTAVWAAIRILSESVAQLPLNILETDNSGNKIKSTNHQLYNLIHRKPNDIMTTYTFIQKCMMDLLTRGNSFVFINRNTNGRPIELLPLEVGKVKLVENEGVIYYELQDGGIVDHYDILHFKILTLARYTNLFIFYIL